MFFLPYSMNVGRISQLGKYCFGSFHNLIWACFQNEGNCFNTDVRIFKNSVENWFWCLICFVSVVSINCNHSLTYNRYLFPRYRLCYLWVVNHSKSVTKRGILQFLMRDILYARTSHYRLWYYFTLCFVTLWNNEHVIHLSSNSFCLLRNYVHLANCLVP